MKFEIPTGAQKILQTLTDAGHEAYLVGGCVRDLLRRVEPHDWEIGRASCRERVYVLV